MLIINILVKVVLGIVVLVLSVAAIHLIFFTILDTKTSHLQKSDLIVVFPGEKERLTAALDLVEKDLGSNFAVINKTEKKLRKDVEKEKKDVGKTTLLTGGESRSTFEDVYQATKIIKEHNFSSVTLVTASYHMPRALYLLKAHLLGSGLDVKVQHLSVKITEKKSWPVTFGLIYNEIVKILGSTVELTGNLITGKLMYDLPWFTKVSQLAHKYLIIDM